jgi:hypothetical protein
LPSRRTAPEPRALILQSIIPVGAVPERLRLIVTAALAKWGYAWSDVTFAGTASDPADGSRQPGAGEIWVIAISAAPILVGDELTSPGGRVTGAQASSFSGGVIPVIPYQALIYESLGRRGGGPPPEHPSPPQEPRATEPAGSKAPS